MSDIGFTSEEKVQQFDIIAAHFYDRNFGTFSKADMELLMFKFYLEKLIAQNKRDDGSVDYKMCSDYQISKDLGITQQRVRNLKIKKQLVYPVDYSWETALAHLISNARFDKMTNKVLLSIPDPNLYLEIQNFIENSGAYVDKQLNTKILQLRVEYFLQLAVSLETENSKKAIIKKIKTQFKETEKSEQLFCEKEIGKSLIEGAINITSIISSIASLISPDNIIGTALISLLQQAT